MGKKKGQQQNHVQQSMGSMVSKAALSQMGPAIEQLVKAHIRNLGSQLAYQTANTTELLMSRIVVLETLLMEKLGVTKQDLVERVTDLEDTKEKLTKVSGPVEKGDVVRMEVRIKSKDEAEFGEASRTRVNQIGTGQTLGDELESSIIGMNEGETKEVPYGPDKNVIAQFKISRISRGPKKEEAKAETANESSEAQGQ